MSTPHTHHHPPSSTSGSATTHALARRGRPAGARERVGVRRADVARPRRARANREQLAQLVATLCDACIDGSSTTPTRAFYRVQVNGQLRRQPSDFLLMTRPAHSGAVPATGANPARRQVDSRATVLDRTPSSVCVHRVLAEGQQLRLAPGRATRRSSAASSRGRRTRCWRTTHPPVARPPRQRSSVRAAAALPRPPAYSSFWNKVKQRVHHAATSPACGRSAFSRDVHHAARASASRPSCSSRRRLLLPDVPDGDVLGDPPDAPPGGRPRTSWPRACRPT